MDINAIPKVELHCHLEGIVSPQMSDSIRQHNPDFPLTAASFEGYYPVNTLAEFSRWWHIVQPLYNGIRHFYPVLEQYIHVLKIQNVHYFEVMAKFAHHLPDDSAAAIEIMQAFRERLNTQENGDIQIELMLMISRTDDVVIIEKSADMAITLYQAGLICGVSVAGLEVGYPVKSFTHIMQKLHDAGLKIEVHAGEWVGAESVWDALEYGYPDRIGHGVNLFDDERLIEHVLEHNIHIEFCPISNLNTESVARIEDHPIKKALDMGMNFSISTDDPGVFLNSLNDEFQLLVDTFGFTEADFLKIYENSLAARFVEEVRFKV